MKHGSIFDGAGLKDLKAGGLALTARQTQHVVE